MAKPEPDLYDNYDQDPRPDSVAPDKNDSADDEDEGYATFLAPKASFAGKDLDVGAVHRVRIERVLGDEVELRCIQGGGADKPEAADNASEEQDEMYT